MLVGWRLNTCFTVNLICKVETKPLKTDMCASWSAKWTDHDVANLKNDLPKEDSELPCSYGLLSE